ncbi:hypothetical protein E2605_07785 [Dysgonomonas capnocytophagoides]|uniref:DNA repair protein Rad52 n=1 Tax=Dysgonomonas capnocytophagoides TaxID=45254 RepID=A0A4Y8L5D8_9BACT|nr:hypothetical protein [Dysgonomonas capnocytophagoides]TFD96712.1 hypothetical protein E2605_07785 [Dysgonomonas capnocytophagoides]
MENLEIYDRVRVVPENAQKAIQGGRLKGKTDINPMWRIKTLTDQFGICGIGWKYIITKQWLESGGGNEVSAFVNIDLFIKVDGQWSDAIPGTGGSSFVTMEKSGAYTSDECYKMALTDAISVACKSLGMGADIYWGQDSTKYDAKPEQQMQNKQVQQPKQSQNKPVPQVPGESVLKTIRGINNIDEVIDLCKGDYKVYRGTKLFNDTVNSKLKELGYGSTPV